MITLAAAGLFGERIKALLDLRGKANGKHSGIPVVMDVSQ
jgi:hypothetical protein